MVGAAYSILYALLQSKRLYCLKVPIRLFGKKSSQLFPPSTKNERASILSLIAQSDNSDAFASTERVTVSVANWLLLGARYQTFGFCLEYSSLCSVLLHSKLTFPTQAAKNRFPFLHQLFGSFSEPFGFTLQENYGKSGTQLVQIPILLFLQCDWIIFVILCRGTRCSGPPGTYRGLKVT